jgi:hypothetical protein
MDPLATINDLETYLGRDIPDEAEPQAQLLLEAASSAVRTYCGWEISLQQNQTMYVEGSGSSLMTLPTLCLLTVQEVRADTVVLDPAVYPYRPSRKGQIWGYWQCAVQYEFDVDHGFAQVPDVLKLVTMDLTSKQLSNPEGLTSATTGQVTRTWANTGAGSATYAPMSPLHQALLDRYSL